MSRNYQSDSYLLEFDVLKTSIFLQIFILRTSSYRGTTISREFLDRNTLLFK